MTQLARWGITAFPRNWIEILDRCGGLMYLGEAARELDLFDTEPDRGTLHFSDGTIFNPDDPISYLKNLKNQTRDSD